MELKNAQNDLERLAYYLGVSSPRWVKLFLLTFVAGGFVLSRILPWLDVYVPGGAPVTQIFLEMIWFDLMVRGVLGRRRRYRAIYGERAYQKIAVQVFMPAAMLMFAGILRAIWVSGPPFLPFWPRLVFGIYFLAMGLMLEYRGVKSLGIDRVAFVYTVFPKRGTQVTSKLYEFLRHPLYAAMAHMALAVSLFAGTLAGLLCFFVFALKLWLWSKIEEIELVERFGHSYLEYEKKVPGFLPHLQTLNSFWKMLLKGE